MWAGLLPPFDTARVGRTLGDGGIHDKSDVPGSSLSWCSWQLEPCPPSLPVHHHHHVVLFHHIPTSTYYLSSCPSCSDIMVASSDALAPNGTHYTTANGNGSGGLMDAELQPEAPSPPTLEPIAICGLGLRLPGGIRNGDDFWDLLINGRDARGETPSTRFATEGFAAASTSGNGTVPTRYGYYLEDDLARLDTSFFSMSKTELEWCDPQQRLLLEVVRECLDDAGEVNYRGQAVGCYVGTFGQDWYEMTMRDFQSIGGYTMMGCADLVLANRVAYEFDLRGPRCASPVLVLPSPMPS